MKWFLDDAEAKELSARGQWQVAPRLGWPFAMSASLAIALYLARFAANRFMRSRMPVPR